MGNVLHRMGAIALGLGLPFAAEAAIIYNNGGPNQFSGTQMSDVLVAENFTIGAASNISNIRFWSIQSLPGDYVGNVYWAIHTNTSNEPGALLRGGVTASVAATPTGAAPSVVGGYAEYIFDISVVFQLAVGDYWLALHNGPLAASSGNEMLWATTGAGNGTEALYNDGVNGWVGSGNELAFRIDGTPVGSGEIPEPGTFALLAGGLAAAAFLRRKNIKRGIVYTSLLGSAAAFGQISGPIVTAAAEIAVSPSLEKIARDGQVNAFAVRGFRVSRNHDIAKAKVNSNTFVAAPYVTVPANVPYVQTATFQPLGAPLGANFEALGLGTPGYSVNVAPPDTTMGVSDTQIVQWVNTNLAVYTKNGTPLLPAPGFIPGNQVWSGLPAGSLCRQFNNGDPLVQYDRMANRWILSQFAFNNTFTQNAQCIAVSTSSNALGTYTLYQYNFGGELPDYGKLGVWPDAYYITYNMFNGGQNFSGGRACAYDRPAMIAGNPATQICFNSFSRFSYLPSDLDGGILPPVGTPNYHISWNWAFLAAPPYTMQLTKFVPNFNTPANSTFTDGFGGGPFSFVSFDLAGNTLGSCNDTGGSCVPQLGTGQLLDTLGSRHMYRLVYRNFGTYDALLFTQAVDNVAGATAQLRWWELRSPGANPPVVYQNSTFAPSADARWMGSAAFDKLGNIGIGYSVSSSTTNPGIRIAGRRRTDPKNILRAETLVQAGTGSQTTGLNRWGDYSTMQIDPADDCTFWYTTQYIGTNGTFNWRTKVASFKFPNCIASARN